MEMLTRASSRGELVDILKTTYDFVDSFENCKLINSQDNRRIICYFGYINISQTTNWKLNSITDVCNFVSVIKKFLKKKTSSREFYT